MHIRKYRDWDKEAILDIYANGKSEELEGFNFEKKPDLCSEYREKIKFLKSEIYVIQKGENVVGFGGYKNNYISFLYIKKSEQNKGYGEKLLDFLIEKINRDVILHTINGNIKAINFYQKNGFKLIGSFWDDSKDKSLEILEFYREI